jgi:2-polyprenyl-3-methyl-5-hydroxy-6-metoxy-1,4-benzoquinol methylase
MTRISPSASWPESWKRSYSHDLLEIYGDASHRGYSYAYAVRREQTLRMIDKAIRPPATILDVAAAQGNFSLLLAELGYEVTWNDIRRELADYVRLKYESGTVHFAPGNMFELDLQETFDVILITEIIEHVAHPDRFLGRVARMVKRGGYIVMTTPNGGYFRNKLPKFSTFRDPSSFDSSQFKPDADGHIFLLHLDEVEALAVTVGLSLREFQLFTNVLTNGHMKSNALLRILPRRWIERIEEWTQTWPLPLRIRFNTGMAVLMQRPL